mmetsp:Transcript_3192/g.9084  ORF Transcript_3192/g.9084 Transcript_3192/m.9084 type:complete len:349 (+) Transcript_3192:1266-2312(+)
MNLAMEMAPTISSIYSEVPVISERMTAMDSVSRVTPETYATAPIPANTPGSTCTHAPPGLCSVISPTTISASSRMKMPTSLPTMAPMYIIGMKRPVEMAEPAISAAKMYTSAKATSSTGTEKKPLVLWLSTISKATVPSRRSSVARPLWQKGTSSSSSPWLLSPPPPARRWRRWWLLSVPREPEMFAAASCSSDMYAGQGVAPAAITSLQFPGQRRLRDTRSFCSAVIVSGQTTAPWPLAGIWQTVGDGGKRNGRTRAIVVHTTITAIGSAMRAHGTHRPRPLSHTARRRAMRVLMKVKGTARQPQRMPMMQVPSTMMAMEAKSVSKSKRFHITSCENGEVPSSWPAK